MGWTPLGALILQQLPQGTARKSHRQTRAAACVVKGGTMSLTVTLLVVTLLSQCWSAPQRRNWTPQAILYLKGAQRHRSVLERISREEGGFALHPVTHKQSSDGLGESLPSIFLELLQRAVEEGGGKPDNYADKQELDMIYF